MTGLNNWLRGTGHYVLPNARLRTPVSGSFVYPDVWVSPGVPRTYAGSRDSLLNPALIIEVLSPSTEDYDHGKKFTLYREIPPFADYLLVHTSSAFVEHFSR